MRSFLVGQYKFKLEELHKKYGKSAENLESC